jgi:hypothetical protein
LMWGVAAPAWFGWARAVASQGSPVPHAVDGRIPEPTQSDPAEGQSDGVSGGIFLAGMTCEQTSGPPLMPGPEAPFASEVDPASV